ncbi:hypothetical protein FRB97_003777 [Tulasnella sp. 331]|nr:hypothetical protein FRB97_003777 [Tulasnella sp. 331]
MHIFEQVAFDESVDGPCNSMLSHKQSIGLSFIAQSGLISSVAVLMFLFMVARNYIRNLINPPPGKWRLIRTHVDAYLLSLMCADLLQAVGAILTARWALEQRTYCSSYCTTQGVIQQMGETGVAMSTLAITFHTFFSVFFHFKLPQWVWVVVVAAIWLFLGSFVGLSYFTASTAFYTPTPFWCWVSDHYDDSRLFAEYLWMWSAAIINIVLYIPLYFCVRGNIKVNPVNKKITLRFGKERLQEASGRSSSAAIAAHGVKSGGSNNSEALKLIWYPISYTALILPISVARWSSIPNREIVPVNELPILQTSITVFIFGLSGLVNVLLFLWTRPHLLLFGPRRGLLPEAIVRPGGGALGASPSPSFITSNSMDAARSGWPQARHGSDIHTPASASLFGSISPAPYSSTIRSPSPYYNGAMSGHGPKSIILQDSVYSLAPRIELHPTPQHRYKRSSMQDSFTQGDEREATGSDFTHDSTGWDLENNTSESPEYHSHRQPTPEQPLPPPQPFPSRKPSRSRSPHHHRQRQDSQDTMVDAAALGYRSGQDVDMGKYMAYQDHDTQFQSSRFQKSRFDDE